MAYQAMPNIILLAILFGTTLIVSRFSVGQFEAATYVALRLVLAGLGFGAVYAISRRREWPRSRRLWKHALLMGTIGTAIPMTAIVSSLQFQSSGITSLLITTSPAFTVVMAHFWLSEESLTPRKIVGVLVALSGAMLLAIQGESGLPDVSRASPLGYALVLMAMVCGSGATVYARKYMRDLNPIDVTSTRMWVAAAVAVPFSLLFFGFDLSQVDGTGVIALLYAAAVGTFAGMLLAFYNIQRFGATAAAITAYIIPVVASIGGLLFLGETISSTMIVGMALILGGVVLINIATAPHGDAPVIPHRRRDQHNP